MAKAKDEGKDILTPDGESARRRETKEDRRIGYGNIIVNILISSRMLFHVII